MAQCTIGKRHAWRWVTNVNKMTVSGTSVGFSLKGAYRCECGARKLGAFQSVATQAAPAAASAKESA